MSAIVAYIVGKPLVSCACFLNTQSFINIYIDMSYIKLEQNISAIE